MDLISIIIPLYNVEKYIHRCVDSVVNQTYKNIEIILVNDGSPDNCGKICDEYAKNDNRVKVIHKKNGGVSEARNVGLDAVTGEWLMFLDADDWIHPQTVETLYQAAVENGIPISACDYFETNGSESIVDTSVKAELWTPKDLFLKKHVMTITIWGKLYHRDCLEDIRYPVGKIHEDEFITYRILFKHKKIAFVHQPYYSYYINPEGITKSDWNPKRLIMFEALEEQLLFFRELQDTDLIKFTEQLYLWFLVSSHKNAINGGYMKEAESLTRKVFFLAIKSPKLYFTPDNIWVLEHFFPRFMRIYSLVKGAIGKILKR